MTTQIASPSERTREIANRPAESMDPTIEWVEESHHGLRSLRIPPKVDTTYLSHGYFRYIGKYPPQLVSYILNNYDCEGPVVDPMCGSGTTLTEAYLRGWDSIGIDVNPVARITSRTVSTPIDPVLLDSAIEHFLSSMRLVQGRQAILGASKPLKVAKAKIDWNLAAGYFGERAQEDLEAAVGILKTMEGKPAEAIQMILLNCLRRVSKANIKKMNIEVDDNRKPAPPLLTVMEPQLENLRKRNEEFWRLRTDAQVEVKEGDAKTTALPDESIGTVFLHPPYMTNTAFSEFSQLQLAVLGIPHTRIWKKELRCRGSFLNEPNGAKKYLVGWGKTIQEAARILRPGGTLAIVVGDGKIDYVRIPVGVISAEYGKDYGLELVDHFFNVYANHTGQTQSRRMTGQHVLVLRKPEVGNANIDS